MDSARAGGPGAASLPPRRARASLHLGGSHTAPETLQFGISPPSSQEPIYGRPFLGVGVGADQGKGVGRATAAKKKKRQGRRMQGGQPQESALPRLHTRHTPHGHTHTVSTPLGPYLWPGPARVGAPPVSRLRHGEKEKAARGGRRARVFFFTERESAARALLFLAQPGLALLVQSCGSNSRGARVWWAARGGLQGGWSGPMLWTAIQLLWSSAARSHDQSCIRPGAFLPADTTHARHTTPRPT